MKTKDNVSRVEQYVRVYPVVQRLVAQGGDHGQALSWLRSELQHRAWFHLGTRAQFAQDLKRMGFTLGVHGRTMRVYGPDPVAAHVAHRWGLDDRDQVLLFTYLAGERTSAEYDALPDVVMTAARDIDALKRWQDDHENGDHPASEQERCPFCCGEMRMAVSSVRS